MDWLVAIAVHARWRLASYSFSYGQRLLSELVCRKNALIAAVPCAFVIPLGRIPASR